MVEAAALWIRGGELLQPLRILLSISQERSHARAMAGQGRGGGVKRQSKDWLFSFPEKSIDTTIGRGACLVTLVARADFAVNEGVRGEQGDHQRLHAAIVICICLVGFL